MGNKKPTLSIAILAKGKSKDELSLMLADLDYYFEKCKCDFLEVILIGEKSGDFSALLEGFKGVMPEISIFSGGESLKKIKGEMVIILKPGGERSFPNFEKMVNLSKKRPDLLIPYEKKEKFWVKIMDWKTHLLGMVLKFKKNIRVVRDSELACFNSEAAKKVPVFNFPEAVVFGKLLDYKPEFAKMPEGDFSPGILDYLKTWRAMIAFKIGCFRKKRNKDETRL